MAIAEVRKYRDGMKYVIQPEIKRILPEIGTCDMAEWHIIIEISKDYGKTAAQLKMPIIRDVRQGWR